MSEETELESLLPDTKYIVKWKKLTGFVGLVGRDTLLEFDLKINLPFSWDINEVSKLQKLLAEHKIPIDSIRSHDDILFDRVTFSADLEETGYYKLTSRPPYAGPFYLFGRAGEIVKLKFVNPGERANKADGLLRAKKATDLLRVISEYISLREQGNKGE